MTIEPTDLRQSSTMAAISLDFRLFRVAELQALAALHFELKDLQGLDLFHGRFARDKRWNPANAVPSSRLSRELQRLEEAYWRDATFLDHATHLLLVAAPLSKSANAKRADSIANIRVSAQRAQG